MLLFAARYTLIFWFSFISSSNSDIVLMRYMERIDKGIYSIAACTVQCMQREQQQETTEQQKRNMLLEHCFNVCNAKEYVPSNGPHQLIKIQESLVMTLVCRDDRSLTFRIDLYGIPTSVKENTTLDDSGMMDKTDITETVYVIKRHVNDDTDSYFVYITDDNFFTLSDLKDDTGHNITAVAVHANQTYSIIAKEEQFTTLRRGFTPGNVRDIQVKGFFADESNEMHLKAKIVWKPSWDMTCHYNIIFYSPHSVDYDLTPIRNSRQLYSHILENLTFSSEYEVGIRAKNPNNISKESMLNWKKVVTPSCEEWYNYNFNICAPHEPEGLQVEQIYLAKNELSLNISWYEPKYYPDYYTLRILDLVPNGASYAYNVTKESTSYFIEKIVLRSMFEVHLTAYTPGGNKTAQKSDVAKMYALPDKSHIVKLTSVIFAPIFCIVILSLTAFIICHRRAKLKRYEERCKYFEDLEKKAPIDPKTPFDFPTKDLPHLRMPEHPAQIQLDADEKNLLNDAMEINRNDVHLYEILGEGAFGLVRRGIYENPKLGPREVAVKMLKDQPSADDIKAFRREIEVMKSVDRHPNIVGIIGHCTRRFNEMMLLTEYCSLGNLLDFLRDEWKYLHELSLKPNCVLIPPAVPNRPDNRKRPYFIAEKCDQSQEQLSTSNNIGRRQNYIKHNKSNKISNTTIVNKIKAKYKNLNVNQVHIPKRGSNPIKSCQSTENEEIDATSVMVTALPTLKSSSFVATTASIPHSPPPAPPPAIPLSASLSLPSSIAAENKSYGYDEICTNACKCQVNVIIKNVGANTGCSDTEQLDRLLQQKMQNKSTISMAATTTAANTIEVKNCECRQQLLLAKNNKKNIAAIPPPSSLTIENKSYFCATKTKVDNDDHDDDNNDTNADANARGAGKERMHTATVTAARNKSNKITGKVKSRTKRSDMLIPTACRVPLSAGDLLDIAKQVAVGMEFLAKNKVVHRDLAARNVLVAHDRTIKIADFGLSRDVYQENIYKKTGEGKLPIKWLALESMTHQVYTTQSDVWSYGILLYEIITLGGTPYPSISTNRLLHLLKTGYRMEKPRSCGQDYYNLMYSCWNVNPAERPNFTEIIKIIDHLMDNMPQQGEHDQLMQNASPTICTTTTLEKSVEQASNEDSYMKPLYN